MAALSILLLGSSSAPLKSALAAGVGGFARVFIKILVSIYYVAIHIFHVEDSGFCV
jgi:hypothetical protein